MNKYPGNLNNKTIDINPNKGEGDVFPHLCKVTPLAQQGHQCQGDIFYVNMFPDSAK